MQKLKNSFQNFLQVLKPMSWKERLDHIFTYYKGVFVAIIAVVVIISIGFNAFQRKMNPPLYRGVLVGVSVGESAYTALCDDFKAYLNESESKRSVVVKSIPISDNGSLQAELDAQEAYYQLTTIIGGRELEYVLLDESAWNQFGSTNLFADLREVLPQQHLQQYEDQFQSVLDKDLGVSVPLSIDVTSLPGIQEIVMEDSRIYIAFPGNTENTARNASFLDYLSNEDAKR